MHYLSDLRYRHFAVIVQEDSIILVIRQFLAKDITYYCPVGLISNIGFRKDIKVVINFGDLFISKSILVCDIGLILISDMNSLVISRGLDPIYKSFAFLDIRDILKERRIGVLHRVFGIFLAVKHLIAGRVDQSLGLLIDLGESILIAALHSVHELSILFVNVRITINTHVFPSTTVFRL